MSPVVGDSTGALLAEIRAWFGRFVSLRDEHQALVLALYVLHTYSLQAAGVTPYLVILSPERRCGKTLLLETLEELCRYGQVISSVSEAALYQMISADLSKRPTLLIDEADAIFGRPSEQTEGLRGVINSGNRRSGRVARGGQDGTAKTYSTFACKVLAGINAGVLPDTVQDRSIAIMLQRKHGNIQLERHAAHRLEDEYGKLRKRFDTWARAYVEALSVAEPELPDELSDRAKDGWEPLLAIADLAGPSVGSAARRAALELRDDFGEGSESRSERLLADMRAAMSGMDFISTGELLIYLNQLDERTWHLLNRQQGIEAHNVAKLLKPYGIKPAQKRSGASVQRGYFAYDLEEAWARYLSPEKAIQRDSVTDSAEETPW